ncbi:hypothetical protein ANCDUO_12049 [Ancylostoma duodenale]|uniref:Uncharacterized protein n=1 Tax=Ancylostoma duodenale TaxID=51022 RepID=A0A0C2GKZ2_9BILA|nr:hypothetical protein ANCDUO_12049 [Ancylostoma duodenale]
MSTGFQLANQLQPYFDQTKANSRREQELSDLDNALAEAQNELAQESGKTEDEKQQEIAKIRDELNKIRYGLKLANQLQPYFDQTKANSRREQELTDLDNALAEAQNELAQQSGKTEDEKQQEIAKIRDELNKIRYGLKERLKNVLGGKKNITAETETKAEFLNKYGSKSRPEIKIF